MRTINEIQNEILTYRAESESLSTLEILTSEEINILSANSNSKVAFWRRWIRIVAKALWAIESQFELFKQEVDLKINESRIHNREWYREQALSYQHGFELNVNGLTYNNEGYSDAQIEASKIVKHASVVKYIISGRGVLRMKLAKMDSAGDLLKLSDAELTGFKSFINKKTDAGTFIVPTTGNHDDIKFELDIYYDPTILDNQGRRLDGTDDTPVINCIDSFLKLLKFNGNFIKTRLTDDLQKVSGVTLPVLKSAHSKYGTYNYEDTYLNVGVINEIRTADAGYFKLDIINSVINYIPFNE